jgi:hypothetical protein
MNIAIIGATGRGIGLLKKEIELIEKGRAEDGGFFRVHCSGREHSGIEARIVGGIAFSSRHLIHYEAIPQ